MVSRPWARRGPAARGVIGIVLMGLLLHTLGCGVRGLKRVEVAPSQLASAPKQNATLKAHLRDGSVIVFDSWAFDERARAVRGDGRKLDPDRRNEAPGPHEVALDSVAVFESDALTVPAAMAPVTMMIGLHGLASALCLSNPKACFGSCPTFYAWDGERPVLVAEAFSASVAPALESTDLDALDRVHAAQDRLELTLTNEAFETHVVRRADLVVVPRPPGSRVLADQERGLWLASGWLEPDQALGDEGDCRDALARRDGIERTSLADSTDLAARETLELRFERAPVGELGVVLVARQSLLSTYVFYQALAWMGRSAGSWLASLEHVEIASRGQTFGPARVLGGIEVQVRDAAGWKTVGEYRETGPLASDTRVVRLPERAQGALDVRLRFTRGLWRLDQVGLVAVRGVASPVRVPPDGVTRRGRPDAAALASLRDGVTPLVTLPGDTLSLVYQLPPSAGDAEIFLESRGYYMEWMRDAWLAEENPVRVASLFLDPHAALRDLAPAFKRVEPDMEAMFWGSRYAH